MKNQFSLHVLHRNCTHNISDNDSPQTHHPAVIGLLFHHFSAVSISFPATFTAWLNKSTMTIICIGLHYSID